MAIIACVVFSFLSLFQRGSPSERNNLSHVYTWTTVTAPWNFFISFYFARSHCQESNTGNVSVYLHLYKHMLSWFTVSILSVWLISCSSLIKADTINRFYWFFALQSCTDLFKLFNCTAFPSFFRHCLSFPCENSGQTNVHAGDSHERRATLRLTANLYFCSGIGSNFIQFGVKIIWDICRCCEDVNLLQQHVFNNCKLEVNFFFFFFWTAVNRKQIMDSLIVFRLFHIWVCCYLPI